MASKISLHIQDANNNDLAVIILLFATVFVCIALYNQPYIKRQVQLVKIYVIFKMASNMASKVVLRIKMSMFF